MSVRKTTSWVVGFIATVTIGSAALVGLNAAIASSGDAGSPRLEEGSVIRSAFVVGRGLNENGAPDEVFAENWLKVGAGDDEDSLRATVTDSAGTVLQDGIRSKESGESETFVRDTGEVLRAARPSEISALMWSESSIANALLKEGFELVEEIQVVGIQASVFEQRAGLVGEMPEELFQTAGLDQAAATGIVRRVFVGTDPFGVDLGEEAGYLLSDGTEFIPYYRRITTWEVVNSEASARVFEWSPSAAGEVIR